MEKYNNIFRFKIGQEVYFIGNKKIKKQKIKHRMRRDYGNSVIIHYTTTEDDLLTENALFESLEGLKNSL